MAAFLPKDHTFAVCAYKENPFLGQTLDTILNQDVLGEVVVSTSTLNDHIKQECKKRNIQLIVNPEPHLAGDDWNYAYNFVKTPLVTIAHQDDLYSPDYLSHTLSLINQYEKDKVLLAFSDYYEIRDSGRVESNYLLAIKRVLNSPFRLRLLNNSKSIKKRMLAFGDAICCPAVTLVKKNIGPSVFDTTYKNSCDYKTWVDLAFKEGRFLYLPEKLVGHRIYLESATSRNLSEGIRKKEDLEIMKSLWPSPIARIINSLYAISEKSNNV